MNQSTRNEVENAIRAAKQGHKRYAITTLATLHRASPAKVQAELLAIAADLGLSDCFTITNGCMIPRDMLKDASGLEVFQSPAYLADVGMPTDKQVAGMDSTMGAL